MCKVYITVQARQLSSEFARTHFLLSKLTGKAKTWALVNHLVVDPGCFPDLKGLKDDLRLAFEPSQDEHHHLSAFLTLKQGSRSMLDYIERARHLAYCIVPNTIDMVTQVHDFVMGMNTDHQRFYLTLKPSSSLE
uniref:Retrotransposon gag domain-containing protein n=1 Tax=Hyaloperonospora arabidopsidis (strain Emoy2) TaxID=559515 RepID=M4BXE0_HYAAE